MPKCGWVRFRISREWQDIGAASSARVTKDRIGRWFVSFIRPAPELERKSTGAIVGLDMGVASTVTTSDGRFLQMSKLLSDGQRQRKRRLQRRLARQTKGFSRRKRTKLALAKLAAKETDRRKDWMREDDNDPCWRLRHHRYRRPQSQEHDPFG
ncbi:MAG: transposase [Ferrimicrobium sp.]